MRPVNLFLTEDGVVKLGYYGLTTQSEYYSIKKEDYYECYWYPREVFKSEYEMKSDVWSFGITLFEMLGIFPYMRYIDNCLPTGGGYMLSADGSSIESKELRDFMGKCLGNRVEGRWSVNALMIVSGMGWRMMSSIHS